MGGVEPSTSRLQITRSSQLSYIGRFFVFQRPLSRRDCKDTDFFLINKYFLQNFVDSLHIKSAFPPLLRRAGVLDEPVRNAYARY